MFSALVGRSTSIVALIIIINFLTYSFTKFLNFEMKVARVARNAFSQAALPEKAAKTLASRFKNF